MNDVFRLFPEQGSDHARRVDELFAFILAVNALFVALICVSILWFVVKYRRSSNADRGNPRTSHIPLEILWSGIPLFLSMVMFGWGARLYFNVNRPPDGAVQVDVVAKQWMWKLQQPEGKSELNTLHVALGRPVKLRMISEDVIHSFYVPTFRVKMDVLPGRYTYTWFRPTKVGEYHLFCAEYCGTSHSKMIGRIIVQEPTEFADWLQGATRSPPEAIGRRLFEQFRCDTCHRNSADARCPPLEGLYGRKETLEGGAVVLADDAYIRESIVNPQAKIVAGYRPIMPTFKNQIGEEEILQIIAYLKSLNPQRPQKGRNESR